MERIEIVVTNLALQFDGNTSTSGSPEDQAQTMIRRINSELRLNMPCSQPQLLNYTQPEVIVERKEV
jgi:hypothetical protein